MGMRKYQRAIAKNRLKCMGVGQVNRKMNGKYHLTKGELRKMMGRRTGRKIIEKLSKSGIANWRRVLYGDLAKQAWAEQLKLGQQVAKRHRFRRLNRLARTVR